MSDSDVDVEFVPPSPQHADTSTSQAIFFSQSHLNVGISRYQPRSLPPLPRLPDLNETGSALIQYVGSNVQNAAPLDIVPEAQLYEPPVFDEEQIQHEHGQGASAGNDNGTALAPEVQAQENVVDMDGANPEIIGDVINVVDLEIADPGRGGDVINVVDVETANVGRDRDVITEVEVEMVNPEQDGDVINVVDVEPENDDEDSDTDVEVVGEVVGEDSSRSTTPESDVIVVDGSENETTSNENEDSNGTVDMVAPPPDLLVPVAQAAVVRFLTPQRDSPADFRSPKRRRLLSSPEKDVKTEPLPTECEEEDDSDCCPICFEPWTNSGSHRLASLRCGHLFGQSCIQKWLKGQGGKCPHCNAKAKRQDIRVLYAKSVKALDTSEKDQALKDLEKERETRRKLEMQAAQSRLQYQMALTESNKLRTELEQVRKQLHTFRSQSTSRSGFSQSQGATASQTQLKGQFVLDRTIKIWEAGNCRVLAYSAGMASLIVSQPSASPLFPGFGIKKISAMDFRTSQYLTLHSKAIRDVCFHPVVGDGILLSCGLDKQIKLTSVISNAIIATYETPMPVWSCIWNADNNNLFYAGIQNGTVLEFDTRNTTSHVQELNTEGSRSPVRALQYVPQDAQAAFRSGGLVIGQLDRISFFEKQQEEQFRPHLFPLEGSLTSLHFEQSTRHLLASFRPTAKHATVRHQLCELTSTNLSVDPSVVDNVCTCNVIQTFYGGRSQTILSRTQVVPHPEDNSRLLVCAGEEESSMLHVWDSGVGQLKQRLFTGGMAMDICAININNQTYLAALTDKQLKVHKWS